MAFVFVPETGEGLPNATSYVTVAEADDYFTPDRFFTTWDALTEEQKESFLAWATRLLDQKCEFKGDPTTEEQALRWPRGWVKNRDGITLSSVLVPRPIKEATFELAKYLVTGADLTTGPDVQNIQAVKVDVIEITYQEDTAQVELPSIINAILRPIGYMRLGGLGAAPIVKSG